MALKLRSAGSDLYNIHQQVTPKLHQIKKRARKVSKPSNPFYTEQAAHQYIL